MHQYEIVKCLLDAGYDVNEKLVNERWAICYAVQNDDVAMVDLLLGYHPCLKGHGRYDPIRVTICNNMIDVFRVFLRHGVLTQNICIDDPLCLVIRYGKYEMCEILLETNPDLINTFRDMCDRTPL